MRRHVVKPIFRGRVRAALRLVALAAIVLTITSCTAFLSGVRERIYFKDRDTREEIGSVTVALGAPESALPEVNVFYTRADRKEYCTSDCYDITRKDVTRQSTWWIDDSSIADIAYSELGEGTFVRIVPMAAGRTMLHARYELWGGNAFVASLRITVE